MKKQLPALLLCFAIIIATNINSSAQSKLIYYWNFNTWTPSYPAATAVSATAGGLGIYASIAADYASPDLDTAKARWVDQIIPGTSSAYTTYCDNTAVGDTTNARQGAAAGAGFKARNPNDSMELLVYAPTTHYTNLQIKYACELSSYTSGDSVNVFSYSLDSGATWVSSGTGLSEWVDSGSLAYRLVSVHVNDPGAANNSKFVFRIRLAGRNALTSGNNRYDNVTIEADSIAGPAFVPTQLAATPAYTLFPNPAKNLVSVTGYTEGEKSVVITNVVGETVRTETQNGKNFQVSLSDLVSGIYYMTIRENTTGDLKTLKFVKQ